MQVGGRDSWLSGIFALPFAVVATLCFTRLGRMFPGKTLAEYAPKVLGYAGYLVAALYLLYYFCVIVFTMRMTIDWMVDTILPETPPWVMAILYMAAVLYPVFGGLDVLARINQFTLPLLSGLGMLVSLGTIPAKDYRLLLPLFQNGPQPILAVTFLAMANFGEASIFTMYDAYVTPSDRKKTTKAYLWALLFITMTLTGPLAGSVATLGFRVAQNMPYPTFQHWLMLTFSRFFERTDLLAVHQWLAGAYVRTGLFLLLAVKGAFQLAGRRQVPRWSFAAVGLAAVLIADFAFPTKPYFDFLVTMVYLPAGAILGVVLPILMFAVAWLRGLHRQGQEAPTYGA
jgi:spore germination protein (amino acid permease)